MKEPPSPYIIINEQSTYMNCERGAGANAATRLDGKKETLNRVFNELFVLFGRLPFVSFVRYTHFVTRVNFLFVVQVILAD